MVLIPSVIIDICLHPSLCGSQVYWVKKSSDAHNYAEFFSRALFLILDFLTFSIPFNEFSNAIRKKEPGIENGRRAYTVRECLDLGSMSSVLWYVGDSPAQSETPLLLLIFVLAPLLEFLSFIAPWQLYLHPLFPFTLFQFLPLICCFLLFFSPQPYHATLPLLFPLLYLLTFLGSCLLSADHPLPVMPRPPDPVPISFAFSE